MRGEEWLIPDVEAGEPTELMVREGCFLYRIAQKQ